MALPVGLDFKSSIKSTSAVANTYQLQVEPTNAREFSMSSQIILQVPTRARCYADLASSKISFDVVNGDGHKIKLDSQAGCVFDRVDTKIAGSVLSSIQNYGLLSNFVYDCQMSKEQRTGSFAIESGNSDATVVVATNTGTVVADGTVAYTNEVITGAGSARAGVVLEPATYRTVSHSLIGGIFSSNRFLPLDLASELELDLYLNTAKRAFVCEDDDIVDTNVFIRNVKLTMMVVELDGPTNAAVSAGGYDFMMSDFSTSVSTVEALATEHSVIIPARYSMLKSLYHLPQVQTETALFSAGSQTVRSRGNCGGTTGARTGGTIQEYYVSVGGVQYPSQHMKNDNFYSKLLESWHYNLYDSHSVSFSPGEWEAKSGITADGAAGAFAIGLDLETVRNTGDKLLSGLRTTSSVVQPHFLFNTAPGANMTMTHIAHFDVLARVDPVTKLIQISS